MVAQRIAAGPASRASRCCIDLGPRLPVARAQHADAVARRAAAAAARDAGALEPVRRRLRARRAVGRPAPGRHRGAAARARPAQGVGQLAVRRRARARRDPPRRLDRRRRPGRRRARRRRCSTAARRTGLRDGRGVADARATCSARAAPRARTPRAPSGWLRAARRHAQQPARPRRRASRSACSPRDRRVGLGQVEPGEPGAGRAGRRSTSATSADARTTTRATSSSARRRRRSAAASPAAWSASSAWCASTRSRSAARRARTSPPTPACSTTCASCSPRRRRRARGATTPGRFSFNVAKGRCETCEGEGFVMRRAALPAERLRALPDLPRRALQREDAGGHATAARTSPRCSRMTVDAACEFFADEPRVRTPLGVLREVGLGYLRLGQPATELSGGEAQRIKLATELQRAQRGDTLYVLDEPTTGLHPADVEKLMAQLDGLVDAGNTVIVVEHDMRVVAGSDWVIDIGPGAATRAAGSSPRDRPRPASRRRRRRRGARPSARGSARRAGARAACPRASSSTAAWRPSPACRPSPAGRPSPACRPSAAWQPSEAFRPSAAWEPWAAFRPLA